jgi:hypothetical protein
MHIFSQIHEQVEKTERGLGLIMWTCGDWSPETNEMADLLILNKVIGMRIKLPQRKFNY